MTVPEKRENAGVTGRPAGGERTNLLELLLEQVVDYAIYVIDPAGNVASWNPGAQRIKGYAPSEIIGKPFALFFTEQDRLEGRPAKLLELARQNGRYQDEGWRVRKDGSRFWASVVVTALHDESGSLRGYAKITRDLTERRRAEQEARRAAEERAARHQAELDQREVRRSRDQLDLILKSVAEGVTAQTPDGKLVFANDAAAQLCGFDSADDLLAASAQEVLGSFELRREDGTPFPPDELPGRRALRGEASSTVVRFRSRKSGEERWSFVSGAPVTDSDGKVELAVSVFREFTERRQTEEAWQFLAETSEALASSLEYDETLARLAQLAVPRIADWCGVDMLGPDGTLEQLAVAHVDLRKRELAREWRARWPPPPQALAYKVLRSGVPEIVPDISDAMIDAGAPDPEQRQVAHALGLRSAMVVPLVVGRTPFGVLTFITAESGRRYGARDLILATEVARRAALAVENARAYTEARTAVRTRDNFLAIASHELRTPLSALTVMLTSLARAAGQGRLTQLGPEVLKDRITRVDRQAGQLARLLDRLLDVSRLSTQELRIEREEADLAEIVRDVISRYEDVVAERGGSLELTVSGPTVGRWDRSRIDQVVTNLIGNAVKYAGGTPIAVSLSGGMSGKLRLTVRDHGPGIAPENQERIFGQYERAAEGEDHPGMGLGLWLVRRIVAAHGGAVTLDSRPGEGATFTVIVPMDLLPDSSAGSTIDSTEDRSP
jgi:PAS domain S-box-containing protein